MGQTTAKHLLGKFIDSKRPQEVALQCATELSDGSDLENHHPIGEKLMVSLP